MGKPTISDPAAVLHARHGAIRPLNAKSTIPTLGRRKCNACEFSTTRLLSAERTCVQSVAAREVDG